MGIYRGPGGVGDAVADSSSEVLLALQAKNEAVAAKQAAEAAQAAAETAQAHAETAEANAETAEANAETAEANAETAEANAASSASAASSSASSASSSASAASTSATNAASSASAASTSATNAASSASTASTQATNASNSASAASTSATNAASSASAASTSATNAASSATAAAGSATSASNSASSASTSASNAATSETNAASSASTATTQAGLATTKAGEAATSATNAASSASAASTSATNAASSATAASGSASTASTQATNASNSASAAATSASNAASSATAAAASATAAATSASNAAATLSSSLLKANNLSDLTSVSTARTNLGLGTAATTAATDYATAAQGTKADTALQPAAIGVSVQAYDADLAAFALKTAPSGAVVGTSDSQTLTNKTLTAPTIDKINTSVANTSLGAGNASIMKNRIINGAMVIDQRNAGASVSYDGSNGYSVDRWWGQDVTDGAFTLQRVTDAPDGFINSLKFTTTTADASLGSSQFARIKQVIEGFNIADLGWGTASAKTVTLSFWVKSSLTGTFGGALTNDATNRSYPFTYTISVANTWEQKSITVAGDTTGTWLTNNGAGIQLILGLGVGSTLSGTAGAWAASEFYSATGATSVIGTLNATWYVTGVQLEVGSSSTGFEYRQYGQEIALCQRYYWRSTSGTFNALGSAVAQSTTNAITYIKHPVSMRTSPTFSYTGTISLAGASGRDVTAIGATYSGLDSSRLDLTSSLLVAGQAYTLYVNNGASDLLQSTAEL